MSKAPLREVRQNDIMPMLDSSVVEVCQRASASEAACPVRRAKEGFCNYLPNQNCYNTDNKQESFVSTGLRNECCTGYWMAGRKMPFDPEHPNRPE